MTAAWLHDNATFFPSRGHALVSNRDSEHLVFTAGSALDEKMFEVPLLPAGKRSPGEAYIVHIKGWAEVGAFQPNDDLLVGISDTTNAVGFRRQDPANNNLGGLTEGADGDRLGSSATASEFPTTSLSHHVFEVLLHVTDATRGVAWSGGETLPVAGLYSRSLDRTQDWNFVVFGNEVFEQYKLYAFQVTVTQEGP